MNILLYRSSRDKCWLARFRKVNEAKWRNKAIPVALQGRQEASEWFQAWCAEHNHQPKVRLPMRRKQNVKHSGPAGAGTIWKTYSDGCPFELFLELSQKPCHYCNQPPSNKHYKFTYSGLDRLDSSKDHSPNNVVPCCKDCNFAKRTMSYENFLSMITRIYRNLKLENQ